MRLEILYGIMKELKGNIRYTEFKKPAHITMMQNRLLLQPILSISPTHTAYITAYGDCIAVGELEEDHPVFEIEYSDPKLIELIYDALGQLGYTRIKQ